MIGAVLATVGVLLVATALLSRSEVLLYAAGWHPDAGELPAGMPYASGAAADRPPDGYLVYLDGIGKMRFRDSRDGGRLVEQIVVEATELRVLGHVLPYSPLARPLAERRGAPWLRHHAALALFVYNVVQILVAADTRYRPLYNRGVGGQIAAQLRHAGYAPGSGVPVVLLGYSGGAQIATGAVGELSTQLGAPVTVVLLGGFHNGANDLRDAVAVHRFTSAHDPIERIGRSNLPAPLAGRAAQRVEPRPAGREGARPPARPGAPRRTLELHQPDGVPPRRPQLPRADHRRDRPRRPGGPGPVRRPPRTPRSRPGPPGPRRRGATVFEVTVPALPPDRLGAALGEAQERALDALAGHARADLAGHTLWNVSSTATGGGVAEMLRGLVGYARAAGVDTRWLVVEGDAPFFALTKRIHNLLHGSPGDGGVLGPDERTTYEALLAREAGALAPVLAPGDVVVLHDPQTAGLDRRRPRLRRHPDLAVPRGAPTCAASAPSRRGHSCAPTSGPPRRRSSPAAAYVPEGLGDGDGRTAIIQPAIDPVSAKNLELGPARVHDVLAAAGLLDGRPAAPAGVAHPATLVRDGGAFPRDVPLVVQVSRWDHLKDMAGVLDAFVRGVVDGVPGSEAHLLLAGPSVAGVSDDPEGRRVLEEVTAAWRALPDRSRRRVGLASLDMTDVEENALVVNALQRHATVVTQKSLQEGFGLTVAEAMWKSRPVVASAVGGIRDQIDDGVSGRLVGPEDRPAFAAAIVDLLADPRAARRLGAAAHDRVREHFLPDRQLHQWLDLVGQVRGGAGRADRIADVAEAGR